MLRPDIFLPVQLFFLASAACINSFFIFRFKYLTLFPHRSPGIKLTGILAD